MDKNSRWAFTSWKPPIVERKELVAFMVYQRERTTSGFEVHYQGYVEFLKPYTRTQVKALFKDKSMHIEEAEKSRERNMMYCLKPTKYCGERYMYNGPDDVYTEEHEHIKVLTWEQVQTLLA